MSQPSWTQPGRWLLPLIILVYLDLGMLYALYTPDWQAPDEPAHYNYVQYVAEQHRFPVLKPGDYPAAYLEEIKAAHFPPQMSIAPIRYEFHQPPLYYLLAVPAYRLFRGALLPLRLLSVALGALLLLVVSWTVQALAPNRPSLALGVTAFVAFLPMHLTFIASVNNDTLAELLVATILLLTIRYLKRSVPPPSAEDTRLLVLLGVTTGLGLITKSSAYVALPLVLLAIAVRHLWLDEPPPSFSGSLRAMAIYLLPAIALAMPWWLRNVGLYGDADFLGLGRHEQVVAGQLRTAEFIARHGFAQLGRDFVLTSFRSFWGQFGWMGVLLDQRLYQALGIVSTIALIGLAIWAVRAWRRRAELPKWQWAAGGLLVLSGLFTLASYVWYNITFLQHQGRYLFPALVAIGLAVALGWREALRREHALPLAAGLLAAGVVLRLTGLLSNWPFLMLGATAVALAARRLLPRRWDPLVQAVPYLFLILLAGLSLFLFIVPQLRA
jgi:4-amino-4-deoxy-L-arabinose transferase-like glycosyltransferase